MDSIATATRTLSMPDHLRPAVEARPTGLRRPADVGPSGRGADRAPSGAGLDRFERTPASTVRETQRLLGLLRNPGHTTQILDLKAAVLERNGEHEKAGELRAITAVYAEVGAADGGGGNCCSATSKTLAALRARFPEGLAHWRFDSIGVGAQAGGTSYAHQAVALSEVGRDRPTFVLDPTRMPLLKIPGIPGQGATDAWTQAYTLSEFLRTREANYGSGWSLGVP